MHIQSIFSIFVCQWAHHTQCFSLWNWNKKCYIRCDTIWISLIWLCSISKSDREDRKERKRKVQIWNFEPLLGDHKKCSQVSLILVLLIITVFFSRRSQIAFQKKTATTKQNEEKNWIMASVSACVCVYLMRAKRKSSTNRIARCKCATNECTMHNSNAQDEAIDG